MKHYEKNTLVKDTIVYRCIQPHEPKYVFMRQHDELMEVIDEDR